jgi:hypothetical protein|tara:strand:- start:7465 stop:8400 length:936 start_codon:yes stop_codon:yes gene_type:complete
MPKASNVPLLDRFFGLFTGDPGTGKSMAAQTFPRPIYLFDIDGRIKSSVNHFRADPELLADIDFDQFRSFEKFCVKLEALENRCPYKTVIIDSITTLAQLIFRDVLRQKGGGHILREVARNAKRSQVNDEKGEGARRVGGIMIAGFEEYKVENSAFIEILDLAKYAIKAHVIFTGHTTDRTVMPEKKGDDTTRRALLTAGKQVAAMIPVSFDEVWYFDTLGDISGNHEYVFHTKPTGPDFAKTSMPIPPRIGWTRKHMDKPISATNGNVYLKIIELLKQAGHEVAGIEGPNVPDDNQITQLQTEESRVQVF